MNKQLSQSVLILTGVLVSTFTALTTPVEPVRTMEVPPALDVMGTAIPVLDGIADNVYSDVQTTTIFNPTGYDGEADFTAVFQLCYDPDNLYALVQVTDDINHSYEWNTGNPWNFDNVEFYLQLDTNTVTTSYDDHTVQLRICRGLDSVESPGRAARADYGYYMEAAAAGGWIVELAIPWTCVLSEGDSPESLCDYFCNSSIGFDFIGNDSDDMHYDEDITRDVQSAWDMDDPDEFEDRTEDLAWNNTSVFGYITFSACCPYELMPKEKRTSLNLFPNPASTSLELKILQKTVGVKCYNMQGIQVFESAYHPGELLDISALQSGIYTLVVDGKYYERFIKN